MKNFAITTLGCKVNQYESQQIRQLLQKGHLEPAGPSDNADLVVVNTCCVTHTASAKSRQAIRNARKRHKNATIVVAGCLPVAENGELKNIGDNIRVAEGNIRVGGGDIRLAGGNIRVVGDKSELSDILCQLLGNTIDTPQLKTDRPQLKTATKPAKSGKIKDKNDVFVDGKDLHFEPLESYSDQSRAFLKIQDGCDGFCSYCIVPQIRHEVSNKPEQTVLTEAYKLIYAGHKEIVLTGIFLGAYGQGSVRRGKWDNRKRDSLANLVDKLAQVPGLKRLRLSSLEPADVTDKLVDVMCAHENIVPHLHLPLQSGSEGILKRMNRQYTVDEFRKTLDILNLRLDRPAVTTDIIVGFPTESDADFERTVELAKEARFAKMHVFSFSKRKNTAAERMEPQVPQAVIKERSRVLREVDVGLQDGFRRGFAGDRINVIIEDTDPAKGRCERYFMVNVKSSQRLEKGQFLHCILGDDGVTADVPNPV